MAIQYVIVVITLSVAMYGYTVCDIISERNYA